jgi:hypothetical protein
MRSEEVEMRAHLSVRFPALTLLTVGLACSSTTARIDNTRTATAQDTASIENPPGYQGMARDTTTAPATPDDTTDYLRIERDTTLRSGRMDSTRVDSTVTAPVDTMAHDTAGYDRPQPYDSTSR